MARRSIRAFAAFMLVVGPSLLLVASTSSDGAGPVLASLAIAGVAALGAFRFGAPVVIAAGALGFVLFMLGFAAGVGALSW